MYDLFLHNYSPEYCESNKVDSIVMPDLNLRDSDDLTPLGVALGTGQINVAKQLLEAGADINTTDSQGYGLLHMAIQVKEVQVATFLINNGADVNLRCVFFIIVLLWLL